MIARKEDRLGRHTFRLDLSFDAWFSRTTETMLAYELEILGHVVHLLSFEISDNDVDLVASSVVHSSQ